MVVKFCKYLTAASFAVLLTGQGVIAGPDDSLNSKKSAPIPNSLSDIPQDIILYIAGMLINEYDPESVVAIYSTSKAIGKILKEQFYHAQCIGMFRCYNHLNNGIYKDNKQGKFFSQLGDKAFYQNKPQDKTWEDFYKENNKNPYDLLDGPNLLGFMKKYTPDRSNVDWVIDWLSPKPSWFSSLWFSSNANQNERISHRLMTKAIIFADKYEVYLQFNPNATLVYWSNPILPNDIAKENRVMLFDLCSDTGFSRKGFVKDIKCFNGVLSKLSPAEKSELYKVLLIYKGRTREIYNTSLPKSDLLKHLIQARHVLSALNLPFYERGVLYEKALNAELVKFDENNIPDRNEIVDLAERIIKEYDVYVKNQPKQLGGCCC